MRCVWYVLLYPSIIFTHYTPPIPLSPSLPLPLSLPPLYLPPSLAIFTPSSLSSSLPPSLPLFLSPDQLTAMSVSPWFSLTAPSREHPVDTVISG